MAGEQRTAKKPWSKKHSLCICRARGQVGSTFTVLLYCYFIVIIANCCWYKVKELRHKIFYSPNLGYWSVRLVLREGSLMKSVHPMWSRNVLHILIKKVFASFWHYMKDFPLGFLFISTEGLSLSIGAPVAVNNENDVK